MLQNFCSLNSEQALFIYYIALRIVLHIDSFKQEFSSVVLSLCFVESNFFQHEFHVKLLNNFSQVKKFFLNQFNFFTFRIITKLLEIFKRGTILNSFQLFHIRDKIL